MILWFLYLLSHSLVILMSVWYLPPLTFSRSFLNSQLFSGSLSQVNPGAIFSESCDFWCHEMPWGAPPSFPPLLLHCFFFSFCTDLSQGFVLLDLPPISLYCFSCPSPLLTAPKFYFLLLRRIFWELHGSTSQDIQLSWGEFQASSLPVCRTQHASN